MPRVPREFSLILRIRSQRVALRENGVPATEKSPWLASSLAFASSREYFSRLI